MRTKEQLRGKSTMTTFREILTTARRAEATILQDAAGVAAIAVMLVVGLHLPALI